MYCQHVSIKVEFKSFSRIYIMHHVTRYQLDRVDNPFTSTETSTLRSVRVERTRVSSNCFVVISVQWGTRVNPNKLLTLVRQVKLSFSQHLTLPQQTPLFLRSFPSTFHTIFSKILSLHNCLQNELFQGRCHVEGCHRRISPR